MLISQIAENPAESLSYLERYVNDGSPSGYTEEYNTSEPTNPFGKNKSFTLPFFEANKNQICDYGKLSFISNQYDRDGLSFFVIHPDMIGHKEMGGFKIENGIFDVVPTSSSRTVEYSAGNQKLYIKLHYDGLIGRINRSLPYQKAISGPEVSNIIEQGILNRNFPLYFGIYREIGSRSLLLKENCTWSFVLREGHPCKLENKSRFYIPYFSLFSRDRNRNDNSLIAQLLVILGADAIEIIIEKIILRILEVYFLLIIKEGLQFELNAQNIHVGFDEKFVPSSIIFRDLMGMEKDLTIRRSKKLPIDFKSGPYKYIAKELGEDMYRIRHSFSFDFKFTHYIVLPIISQLKKMGIPDEELDCYICIIRNKALSFISQLDEDYFPLDGQWYYHNNVLLDKERIYLAKDKPLLR